jgi:hypothetical protein
MKAYVTDVDGVVIASIGTETNPWNMTISLWNTTSDSAIEDGTLQGNLTVPVINGVAIFDDVTVDELASMNHALRFTPSISALSSTTSSLGSLSSSSSSSSAGIIAGVVVGCLLLVLVIGGYVLYRRNEQLKQSKKQYEGTYSQQRTGSMREREHEHELQRRQASMATVLEVQQSGLELDEDWRSGSSKSEGDDNVSEDERASRRIWRRPSVAADATYEDLVHFVTREGDLRRKTETALKVLQVREQERWQHGRVLNDPEIGPQEIDIDNSDPAMRYLARRRSLVVEPPEWVQRAKTGPYLSESPE